MRNGLDSVFSNYRAASSMPASLECAAALCCSSSHSGSRWDNGWSRVPYVLALYTGGGGVWGGLGVRKPGDENWQKQLRWQQRRTCPIISSNGLSYHGAPLELVPFATFPAAIQATTLLPSRHHLSQSCDIEHLSNLTEERSLKMMIKLIPGGCLFSNYPQLDPRKTGFHYPFLPQLDTRKKQSPHILLGKWLPTTNYRFTKKCSIPIAKLGENPVM